MTSPEYRPSDLRMLSAPAMETGGSANSPSHGQPEQVPFGLTEVHLGQAFHPFDRVNLSDIEAEHIVLERGLYLESQGPGNVRLVDVATSDEYQNINDVQLERLSNYYNPYGRFRIEYEAAPQAAYTARFWRLPFKLEEVRLALTVPGKEEAVPVVLLEFEGTPYRYWAVDELSSQRWREQARDSATGSSLGTARYAWWYSEADEVHHALAINRDVHELSKLRLTFLPRAQLPYPYESLLPVLPSPGTTLGTPIPRRARRGSTREEPYHSRT